MDLDRLLRERIFDLLLDKVTVDDLVLWFADESQQRVDDLAMGPDLAGDVRLLFSEYGRGDRDQASLRAELRILAKSSQETYAPGHATSVRVLYGSANRVTTGIFSTVSVVVS